MESVRSFLAQTYEPKQLIIVEDGEYSFAHVAQKYKNIHVVNARAHSEKEYKLGQLRNIGLDSIPLNSLFVQWDDDDWHHPQFITLMYQRMVKHSVNALLLQEQVMYSFVKQNWGENTKVQIKYPGIAGTIMARDIGVRYKSHEVKAEDATFLKLLAKKQKSKIQVWKNHQAPEVYLRFIHGFNTWGPGHFRNGKHSIWRPTPDKSLQYLQKILERYKFIDTWYQAPENMRCNIDTL